MYLSFSEVGSGHILDVGIGAIKRVADDRDYFATLLDTGDNADNWLMIPLVDKCVAAGFHLGNDQCYGYKVPPILGGDYAVENTFPIGLSEQFSFLAGIHRQIKSLPDGTRIKIVVKK